MNLLSDAQVIQRLNAAQRGVFSKSDLQTAIAERHPSAFVRRLDALREHEILRRFCRGWYVTESFDMATLSQRIAPDSYVSFSTVLARHLLVGSNPENRIVAVKIGRPRRYENLGRVIEHVSITERLLFGFSSIDGVRYADSEKAFIDTLYYHLRGRRYPFDIYSDLAVDRLDRDRVAEYLRRYRNQKFARFVEGVLSV